MAKRRTRYWQPTLPAAERSAATPVAKAAGASTAVRAFSYLTVDEISDGIVTLLVSAWPELDRLGRLRFTDISPATAIAVDQVALERLLTKARTPRKLARRPLRESDTFAAETTAPLELDPAKRRNPAEWIVPPIYDITADARDAAKASFFSAVGRPLTPRAERLLPAPHDDKG